MIFRGTRHNLKKIQDWLKRYLDEKFDGVCEIVMVM